MREEDIRKSFEKFINAKNGKFETRDLSETKSDSYLESHKSREYIYSIDAEFARNNVISFIKTFYGKLPANFKTNEYKAICREFNKQISNKNIKNKIELIISTGKINVEDFLPGGDLYSIINLEIMLSDGKKREIKIVSDDVAVNTDDAISLTVFQPNANKARVYVNPSSKDFINFIKYVNSKCMENEIMIDHKIRYGYTKADRIIYYVPIDCLGNFLNILNQYEEKNPDKVAEYNLPPTLLGKTSHNWYGYGHIGTADGQKHTLNDCMDSIINFAFLMLFVNNYEKMGISETFDFKQKMCNTLKNDNYMEIKNKKLKISFFKIFENVSRQIEDQKSRGLHIKEEVFSFMYLQNSFNSILNTDINVREKFNNYCKEHFDELVPELIKYIQYIQGQIPFLDKSNIYLTSKISETMVNNTELIREFIELVYSKRYIYTEEDKIIFEQELSEFLNKVGGLDNIILAFDYCEGIESLGKKELEYARRQIDKLRKKRGLEIIRNKTPLSELSRFESEDASFDNINEIIYQQNLGKNFGIHSIDDKQYDIYRSFIDAYGDFLDEQSASKLEESINKYIQNSSYKKKLLEYLQTKLSRSKKVL